MQETNCGEEVATGIGIDQKGGEKAEDQKKEGRGMRSVQRIIRSDSGDKEW